MTKSVEKSQTQPLTVSFNSTRDYATFAVLICLIVGGLAALYIYNQSSLIVGTWAKEFYNFLLN